VKRARKYRKLLGGGMRQVGILAAAGLIALEKMTERLHIDHDNARYLAEKLAALPQITVDMPSVQINIVFFEVGREGFNHDDFIAHMAGCGIKMNAHEDGKYRFVTHNDISRGDIDFAVEAMERYLEN
jgi:threonine aldolase